MSLIDLCCLCIFLVFAHLSESRMVILRDYDVEPFVFHPGGRSTNDGTVPELEAISISARYRPKKMQNLKKAILQYSGHIYHLDNFEDLKELRSKIFELKKPLKDVPVSYDYVDINDWRAIDSAKDGDLLILPGTPLQFCNGGDCLDRKMFRKYDDHKDWKRGKKQVKYIKRFQIVDNRHSTKEAERTEYDSSEKKNKKKKISKKHAKKKKKKHIDSSESKKKKKKQIGFSEYEKKKKKQVYSSESTDSEKLSRETWESNKKKKYSWEESREIIKKPRKKYENIEDWTHESNSIENIPKKIKKKNKKKNYESDETSERKTIDVDEVFFVQGNKIFHSKNRKKKKRLVDDRRRRLEHFLPKRYHWEPEEIHDLGYFWFNGPKGLYPAPKRL